MALILLNIYILIIIINITYAIYALSKGKYNHLWYYPLTFIFLGLFFSMDLSTHLGLYGKRATLEFICVRPVVAADCRKGRPCGEAEGVIEFFSDVILNNPIGSGGLLDLRLNEEDSLNISDIILSRNFYCKGIQDNKYIYCALFNYPILQKKLKDIKCHILFYNMIGPRFRTYDMVIPSKYLIKDTTIDNKPNEIL